MKLIKEGQLPEKRIYIGTCSNCGSIMESERGELKIVYGRYTESHYITNRILCNKSVTFKTKPPEIT